jgi:phosphatidylinositol-3-phosphatase
MRVPAGTLSRRLLGAVAVVVTAALAVTALADAAANLIVNSTFEGSGSGSLTGWAASNGTLSLVAGEGGGHAARVKASSTSQVYAYTSSRPVASTTAGTAYQLGGDIRSDVAGQNVCLKLKELPAGGSTAVGTAQSCLTTSTTWQPFPAVSYTTKSSGDSLTVNVAEASPASGATYDLDNMSLTVGGAAVDGTPPSVPGGVAANADGPGSVTVTWSPSNDNVGVAGYDVFRDGTRVGTVTGTTLTDGGVQPSTTYGYTVDAFDAAGNHSQQSSPAASVTTPPAATGGPCGALASSFDPLNPPVYSHVVVIMDENLSYNGWFGSPAAPYSNGLAAQCALATNAVAATHPSQPNYVAPLSGVLEAWTGAAQHMPDDNLLHQLDAAGRSWLALEESMTKACSGTTAGNYKTGHNPAVWFTDLSAAGDGSCATNDVGFTLSSFSPAAFPAFTWITPNLCDDMHWQTGCPGSDATRVQSGDTWLSQVLPTIFSSPDYQAGRTLVLLTWDEGNESSKSGIDCTTQTSIDSTGCHVGLVAASAYITPGTKDATRYTPYSVLAAIENMEGLPLLGRATTATPLGPAMGF